MLFCWGVRGISKAAEHYHVAPPFRRSLCLFSSLSLFVSVSVFLSSSHSLCLSVPASLFLCLSVCVLLCLFCCLCLSLSLFPFFFVCLCLFLFVSSVAPPRSAAAALRGGCLCSCLVSPPQVSGVHTARKTVRLQPVSWVSLSPSAVSC